MPFTLSHAAAVLPLAGGRPGRRLLPAALVIGSWVPDLPYFVPPHRGSSWTHAASGPFTIDLVLGLVVTAGWLLVLRRPLVDFAPRWLAVRVPPARPVQRWTWPWAAVSVVIGALTHVVWDTFTHPRRWGTTHVAVLATLVGPLPLYKWLQFGSSVFGLLAVGLWCGVRLRRADVRGDPAVLRRTGRRRAWLITGLVFVGSVLLILLTAPGGLSLEALAFRLATGAIGATTAAGCLLCVAWRLAYGWSPAVSVAGRSGDH